MYTVRTIVSTHNQSKLISLITTDEAHVSFDAAINSVATKIDANDIINVADGHTLCYELVLIAGSYSTSISKFIKPEALDEVDISYETEVCSPRHKHFYIDTKDIGVAREQFFRFAAVSLGMHNTKDMEAIDTYARVIQRWMSRKIVVGI